MKCPICKEEIEDGAQKCKHCGSYVKSTKRIASALRSTLELATFIAAIIVLYFMWQANRATQQQLDLQRKSQEELSKEFIEEKRPRIEMILNRIELQDTSLVLYVDYDNNGFADAEDLLFFAVLKYEDSPGDTIDMNYAQVSKISRARGQSHKWFFGTVRPVSLTCLIQARYTWKIKNLNYKEEKYFSFPYDKGQRKYGNYVLNQEQIERLWK